MPDTICKLKNSHLVVLDVCLFHQKVIHILPNLKEIYYQIGFGLVICSLSYTYATNMPRISSTT